MIKVALIGVGRTGSLVAKSIIERKMQIVAAFAAQGDPQVGQDVGILAGLQKIGVNVSSAADLAKILDSSKPDVVVDFTVANAFMQNLGLLAGKKLNLVVGTTGFSEQQLNEIKDVVKKKDIGVVLSPNMSVGVNVFWQLCREAARNLKGYNIEIIDKHHKFKKDSPSGTALKAAQIIAEAQGLSQRNFVYGRQGQSLRNEGDIGIHAIRAGNIVGEHTVIFASLNERIEITHIAQSREAFAEGVPKAIEYIREKKGFYGMDDVLGLK
ncbi:MAG: 4-hydroxy-tetrahydrodipicolinate reductase [Candidatus Altiarchaeales archaeon]|nr:4-hydroxy-tetrahydrodipicolinate reductase [Candidatus Altiarchaeales archaeon]